MSEDSNLENFYELYKYEQERIIVLKECEEEEDEEEDKKSYASFESEDFESAKDQPQIIKKNENLKEINSGKNDGNIPS